jgi:hypothetical protein
VPNENLATPSAGSLPTVASSRPSSTDSQPFPSVAAPTDADTDSPNRISAKISGGPNALTAQSAIAGVAIIMRMADMTPPSAEHDTAAPTALPARPCCAIG